MRWFWGRRRHKEADKFAEQVAIARAENRRAAAQLRAVLADNAAQAADDIAGSFE